MRRVERLEGFERVARLVGIVKVIKRGRYRYESVEQLRLSAHVRAHVRITGPPRRDPRLALPRYRWEGIRPLSPSLWDDEAWHGGGYGQVDGSLKGAQGCRGEGARLERFRSALAISPLL